MVHFTSVRYAGDSILYVGNSTGTFVAFVGRSSSTACLN